MNENRIKTLDSVNINYQRASGGIFNVAGSLNNSIIYTQSTLTIYLDFIYLCAIRSRHEDSICFCGYNHEPFDLYTLGQNH